MTTMTYLNLCMIFPLPSCVDKDQQKSQIIPKPKGNLLIIITVSDSLIVLTHSTMRYPIFLRQLGVKTNHQSTVLPT